MQTTNDYVHHPGAAALGGEQGRGHAVMLVLLLLVVDPGGLPKSRCGCRPLCFGGGVRCGGGSGRSVISGERTLMMGGEAMVSVASCHGQIDPVNRGGQARRIAVHTLCGSIRWACFCESLHTQHSACMCVKKESGRLPTRGCPRLRIEPAHSRVSDQHIREAMRRNRNRIHTVAHSSSILCIYIHIPFLFGGFSYPSPHPIVTLVPVHPCTTSMYYPMYICVTSHVRSLGGLGLAPTALARLLLRPAPEVYVRPQQPVHQAERACRACMHHQA